MSNYGKLLAEHLSTELNVDVDAVITALDKFTIGASKKESKSSAPSKASKKEEKSNAKRDEEDDEHKCCRIKRGQTEPCGNPAKKSIGDKWYCDKSRCYATVLKAEAEKELNQEAGKPSKKSKSVASRAPSVGTKIKAGKAVDRKAVADNETASLINKVNPKKQLIVKKYVTKSMGTVFYDPENRYLVDYNTKEIYGILGKDNDSIVELELDDEQVRFIEASGFFIRAKKPRVDEATVESANSEDEMSNADTSKDEEDNGSDEDDEEEMSGEDDS